VSQIADRRNADALTVGDQVVLATGHDERNASTVAVLAHELTHVARVREPRFVPPIVGEPASSAEEPIALDVERAVRHSAQRERSANHSVEPPRTLPESVERSRSDARQMTPAQTRATESVRTPAVRGASVHPPSVPSNEVPDESDTPPWGDLPAPWEPLPDVVTRMQAQTEAHADTPGSFAPAAPISESTAAPAVQAAARDRNAHEPASGEAATPSSGRGASPAPDVDALARQVYDVLKRRLAAERRRGA
jgi:hypothetical protein